MGLFGIMSRQISWMEDEVLRAKKVPKALLDLRGLEGQWARWVSDMINESVASFHVLK